MNDYSARAAAVTLRTYCRPRGEGLESPEQMIDRAHRKHHKRLAEEVGKPVSRAEIEELVQLGLERKSWVAGRTLWLGGTDYAFSRPCCQFNCSYLQVANVYDAVDAAWLLLNGSGVGFRPVVGTLHGSPGGCPSRSFPANVVPTKRDARAIRNPTTVRCGRSALVTQLRPGPRPSASCSVRRDRLRSWSSMVRKSVVLALV